MRRKYLRFGLLMLAIGILETQAQSIHVSPKGSDKNPGTKEKPVASLTAAKALVRNHKKTKGIPKGGLNVISHEGIYDLQQTFQLSEEDAGKKDAPITWSAAAGEKVNITGGKTIQPGKFSKVVDKGILNRFEKNAIGNVWQVNLRAEGINNLGNHRQYGHGLPVVPATLELFFNGEPMTLSRYPNKGAMKIGKVSDPGSVPRNGDKSNRGALFAYTDSRHKKWVGQ